jgi:LPXTG-site transpeptidase (sortase) family protein
MPCLVRFPRMLRMLVLPSFVIGALWPLVTEATARRGGLIPGDDFEKLKAAQITEYESNLFELRQRAIPESRLGSPGPAPSGATGTPVYAWASLGTASYTLGDVLAVDESGNVYLAGRITSVGGISSKSFNNIGRWDRTHWTPLSIGFGTGAPSALITDGNGNLYAGGDFYKAGWIDAKRIARWDGYTWNALGSGFDNAVDDLVIGPSDELYAGGIFVEADEKTVNFVAVWDGSQWSALGTGLDFAVSALALDEAGKLYAAGGIIYSTPGGYGLIARIACWDGNTWINLMSEENVIVYSLAVDSSGYLYAGGTFTSIEGVSIRRIARWDGSSWSPLGSGMNNSVLTLVVDESGNLFAGGSFTTAGGVSASRVARWDGSEWSALGSGMNDTVFALAVDGSGNLYAAGHFSSAGGVSANGVAVYTTAPEVSSDGVGSLPDIGDGGLGEGEAVALDFNLITLTFTEDLLDQPGEAMSDDVTNPANYSLVKDATTSIPIDLVSYSNGGGGGPYVATVAVNGGLPLSPGDYTLTVHGSTSITGRMGARLAGDGTMAGTDFVRTFSVSTPSAGDGVTLPKTGFTPGRVSLLPKQPADKASTDLGDLWLEIPNLGVEMPIVGVPRTESGWNVTWLEDQAGWLEGTAFPTWTGNTALTAHVWDAWNRPGPFAKLKELGYGDRLRIHAWGRVYTYEVRDNLQVRPDDLAVLGHSEYDLVTMLTCEGYNLWTAEYRYRRAVQAVLMEVGPEA